METFAAVITVIMYHVITESLTGVTTVTKGGFYKMKKRCHAAINIVAIIL